MRELIAKLTLKESDQKLDQATGLLATHHWSQAETLLRQILQESPEYQPAMIKLARALLAQGRGCEAIGHF